MSHDPPERFRRRNLMVSSGVAAVAVTATKLARAQPQAGAQPRAGAAPQRARNLGYTPVQTPGGASLPYKLVGGAKEFHLIAEEIAWKVAPKMVIKCRGYNGRTPGPTIEAVEGDRVRLLVTNKLKESTTIHWHGLLLPCGMDGVGGLTQPAIEPGETYLYEFELKSSGTFLYYPHADRRVQQAAGMMGLFIVHPKRAPMPRVDRDFAIMLQQWAIPPGTYRPDPNATRDFNLFTFNSKVYPATPPLVVRTGQRVRLRLGNLSTQEHPIHLHGHSFKVTATDGGPIPKTAQWPLTTVSVPPGSTRDIQWVAKTPGDWALHCTKPSHTLNTAGRRIPNTRGADQKKAEARIRKMLPGHQSQSAGGPSAQPKGAGDKPKQGPRNTLAATAGAGPYGDIEMGGMFTIVKVRDNITSYADPGWYKMPQGTQARKLSGGKTPNKKPK